VDELRLIDVLDTVLPLIAILFSGIAMFRNRSKDDAAVLVQLAALTAMMGEMKEQVAASCRKSEDRDKSHHGLAERVIAVESSAKQAHKRLDRIEGRQT
jgi:hypothetical protein